MFIVLVSKVDFATDKAKATGVQTDFRSFQYAFDTVAILNEGITGIRENAFYGCTGISEIIIPSTVTLIENYAFAYSGIESITFNGTIEQWNSVSKSSGWKDWISAAEVICSDGTITLS